MKGIINGKIILQGKWDDVSFDMDNFIIRYRGRVNFSTTGKEEIMDIIKNETERGKLILSDGLKPMNVLQPFKL